MPAYNVEKYIADAIESVRKQTYSNFELIIINDGSTDKTEEISKGYTELDTRIKLFSKHNGGLSSARNYGLNQVSGDYILFLDSDDYISENCIELLVKIKEEYHADVSVCSFLRVNENKKPLSRKKHFPKDIVQMTGTEFVRNIVGFFSIGAYAWGKLFDAETIRNVQFPEGRLWEDVMVIPYLLYQRKLIVFYKEPLWFYRVREGSIMNSYSEKRTDEIDSYQMMIDFGKNHYDRILEWEAKRWFVRSIKYLKKMCDTYNKGIMPDKFYPYFQISKEYKKEIIRGYFEKDILSWSMNNIGVKWDY